MNWDDSIDNSEGGEEEDSESEEDSEDDADEKEDEEDDSEREEDSEDNCERKNDLDETRGSDSADGFVEEVFQDELSRTTESLRVQSKDLVKHDRLRNDPKGYGFMCEWQYLHDALFDAYCPEKGLNLEDFD
jgi:hypothetical protein